jgi:3-oxoacyl-[acyl-carrier protein] reductase
MVTGAASGIGRAVAERIVADGGRVVIGDIDESGLARVAEALGDACAAVRCDVTVEDGPAALAAAAIERFGRLDLAVACAGGGIGATIVDHSLADWRRVIDLTLTGSFLTVQAAARAMTGPGAIVAISSISAKLPAVGIAAYGAAKAGVIAMAETAALELGPRGIRVNIVAPGLVRTPATESMWAMPDMVAAYAANTMLGRHGLPEEVAAAVAFLLSEDAALITGATLFADAGAQHLRYPDLSTWRRRAPDAQGGRER